MFIGLNYHTLIATHLTSSSRSLLVQSRGLGLLSTITAYLSNLKTQTPDSLIVLLNFEMKEIDVLSCLGFGIGTEKVDSKLREVQYRTGGIIVSTARVFLMDLLENRVQNEVAGVIVNRADRINSANCEAYCVELIMRKNKVGGI